MLPRPCCFILRGNLSCGEIYPRLGRPPEEIIFETSTFPPLFLCPDDTRGNFFSRGCQCVVSRRAVYSSHTLCKISSRIQNAVLAWFTFIYRNRKSAFCSTHTHAALRSRQGPRTNRRSPSATFNSEESCFPPKRSRDQQPFPSAGSSHGAFLGENSALNGCRLRGRGGGFESSLM